MGVGKGAGWGALQRMSGLCRLPCSERGGHGRTSWDDGTRRGGQHMKHTPRRGLDELEHERPSRANVGASRQEVAPDKGLEDGRLAS